MQRGLLFCSTYVHNKRGIEKTFLNLTLYKSKISGPMKIDEVHCFYHICLLTLQNKKDILESASKQQCNNVY